MNTYLLIETETGTLDNVEVKKLFEAKDQKSAEQKIKRTVTSFLKKKHPDLGLSLVEVVRSYSVD